MQEPSLKPFYIFDQSNSCTIITNINVEEIYSEETCRPQSSQLHNVLDGVCIVPIHGKPVVDYTFSLQKAAIA